jgi:hypothetical protein
MLAGGWAVAAVSGNRAKAADAVSIPRMMVLLIAVSSNRAPCRPPGHSPGHPARCSAAGRLAVRLAYASF